MLPSKTYQIKNCVLYESDFDVSSQVKIHRVMEFMQDLATAHADELGFSWNRMDANGLFWVMSKAKIVFGGIIDRNTRCFKLYTWPIKANRFFIERRFEAVDEQGKRLFSATTIWMIAERDTRKIASQDTISKFYNADFDDAPCGADTNFTRIRRDDAYELKYTRTIRRTDLDINLHVNNTNYVNYALDVLNASEQITNVEITYHKELVLNDIVNVYCKRADKCVFAAGERNGETCFTAMLALA